MSQDEIYNKLKNLGKQAIKEGIEPDPALENRRGGFFITVIHPKEITEQAVLFSKQISKTVPAIVYGPKHIHTTLIKVCTNYGPHFYFNPKDTAHIFLLSKLHTVAEIIRTADWQNITIHYDRYIYTQNVVIAAGTPNKIFCELTERLKDVCTEHGLNVTETWGAHITLSRFTEKVEPKNLCHFIEILKKASPLGKSCPVGMAIGYTLRRLNEKNACNLSETPGHFHADKVFMF